MKVVILLLFCCALPNFSRGKFLENEVESAVEVQCIQHCPYLQNRTDIGHYDYACNYNCTIEQCHKGCKLWKSALDSSCRNSCNGTSGGLTPRELYCVMGCNDALTKYFAAVRARLGVPPAPALLPDTLGATSLRLEWRFPEALRAGLTCHVQWRYEDLGATWQYCRDAKWDPGDYSFRVEGLQPYTKYRFRVALHLGRSPAAQDPPRVLSAPSVVVSTLAGGLPASPPRNVRATAVDARSFGVGWEPGTFPRGPLLSYVLSVAPVSAAERRGGVDPPPAQAEVKDISPDNNFFMFRDLTPETRYQINISMRNNAGAGPPAITFVKTPAEIKTDPSQPVLIVGTNYCVFKLWPVLGDPTFIYYSTKTIRGMGVHVNKKILFVSESNGYITRIQLDKTNEKQHVLSPQQLDFYPLDLSIDWLNDQLYILGEVKSQTDKYIIKRCNLDGSGLSVALAGLNRKPLMIQVDPYNGFLFWTIKADFNRGGLYRLDLSDISNGVKREVKATRIVKGDELGAFVIDYTNFRLLVSYQYQNTINAMSLDGKDIINFRKKVVVSKFEKVISLTMANKKFYWTDGVAVFNEEYHNDSDNYFHNINNVPNLSHNTEIIKLFSNHSAAQPLPVPVNPPTKVQAIFGSNIARIRWLAPHLLGVQGKGAWQNWSYEVSIKEIDSNNSQTYKYINSTSFTVSNLTENSKYIMKVAAYTSAGKGPWSTEFIGSTLPKNENPIILWSTVNGLIKSDAVGEGIDTLIDKTAIQNQHFKDITWYRDVIYLVSNTSQIHCYNLTSKYYHKLQNLNSVDSIAIDWIGKKLYWSNPKQQLIIRGNLNGSHQEPLPIVTLAKEMNIDSVMAYIYWSTEYKVECAHLNGADMMKYHQVEYFTGKQVTGLTLDMENKFVYWTVRGSDGSNLYKARMAGYFPESEFAKKAPIISLSKNPEMPLCYFYNRLLWLHDDKSAIISDLEGQNIARISNKAISGLNMVYVMDDSMHVIPEKQHHVDQIHVIPEMIDKDSIQVIGSSESFNITWNKIENVNYGTVFYEIQIDTSSRNDSVIKVTEPSVKYWRKVKPFTLLHVAIRAFTYWSTSPQVTAKVFSPPSTPSVPKNLRAYVVYEYNNSIDNYVSIIFRWDPPLQPNGVLQGYKVRCWYLDNDVEMDICDNVVTQANNTEYIIKELTVNEMYYFEVQAFTEIGYGTLSETIGVNSSHESPLPTLVIASSDSIFIDDIDSNNNKSLVTGIHTPLEINYLMKENKLFWINKMQELLIYNFETDNKTKIFDIKGEPTGITIDWLERSIYYAENERYNNGSTIYKIDLNRIEKGLTRNNKVLSRPNHISKIEISPFTKKIYWTETADENTYELMQSNLDGTDIQPFFQKYNYKRDVLENALSHQCNCSFDAKVDSTFTIDHSDAQVKPLVIFIDSQSQNVISTDKNGCFCNIIANNTLVSSSFPLKNIKSDFGTLYWTNRRGLLYALKRKLSNIFIKPVNVHDILIYGQHTQPYPPVECLEPQQYDNLTVSLIESYSYSLLLKMPEYSVKSHCLNTSVATVFYTVFYKPYNNKNDSCIDEECKNISTSENELEIPNLKPFTKYTVSVAIRNYFTESTADIIGPPTVFQTAPGAPSKARNVSALVLHPTLVEVNWLPPEQLNGIVIHYEIHWLTKGSLGVKQKGEQPVVDLQYINKSKMLKSMLTKLSPNETYTIWIRVYSETNETSSDSDRVQITTYQEPPPFKLINTTAYNLKLMWKIPPHIRKYVVEHAPITTNEWIEVSRSEQSNGTVFINAINLKPKTQYKFRLSLLYDRYSELYVWPSDSRFTFETCGDRPSPPGIPIIQYVQLKIYKVWWEASKDNGAPVEMYLLEGIKLSVSSRNKRSTNRTAWSYLAPSIDEEEKIWEPLYNGTDTSWIINGISDKYKYAFRVTALNSYGWSEPSPESTEFDINEAARIAEKPNPIYSVVAAICVPIILCFSVISCTVYLSCSTRCKKEKEKQITSPPRGPDVELATLRELPRRGIHNTNILYVSTTPNSDELTKLPHIRRDQITLTKFLGSGAFGEVFEGKAKGITNDGVETKVAVKTLKKGASDQEKSEFLQEAQLMSHFKHEHILQLLGVCLDNDPHFIIMELMQGGDLLTYLRESRHPSTNKPSLTLIELLKMCVDVSKGCKYLEEKHFVHRDLACRNCLVSSIEADTRIVKIGDFGLARDIYKNDYYRKEGEGLLPVRWMAPESLVDGVFTSQSDVWAFGVLLWEIMTLGQQPYPARNNLEVLHYVRGGGRLGKPTDCPTDLYKLMLECWEYDPVKRPTFKYCLSILENLHRQKLRNPTTAAHEGQYISTVPELFAGISNAAYFLDENYNSSGVSLKSESEDENVKEKTPFLSQENENKTRNIPKYLELIYEPDSTNQLENDGYEVPNPVTKTEIQQCTLKSDENTDVNTYK